MDAKNRISFLRTEINRLDHEYYVLSCSSVTDADYDALYRELVELERKHPSLADTHSPTQRIGGISKTGFKKVEHTDGRMLSLDNMRTAADVINYLGTEDVVMEPKVDGASVKLIYVKGRLHQALTRGIGTEGDDITANARAIANVPLVLSKPVNINVVGEVYMTYTVFNELNVQLEKAGEEPAATPRNAAAGAIKLKDPKEVAARHLRYVAYGTTTKINGIQFHSQLTDYLETLGFQSVYMLPVTASCSTVADQFKIEGEAQLARRIKEADVCRGFLDMPTDGLVFKINDLALQRELGDGTKYPNYACAFKFPAERKATILLSVDVQVGRTGRVTPVANLQPVLLGGTVVRRASLCNQAEVDRLNIDIGDSVLVEKSAEIIPKVVGVAEKNAKTTYHLPKKCPCCGTVLVQPAGFVDTYCPNKEHCADQIFERLRYSTGKLALDIDGCGDVLVGELIKHGAKKLSDVFTIDPSFLKPAARKRFIEGRAACAAKPLWRKLCALGIEGLGQTMCKEIAVTWDSLSAAFASLDEMKKLRSLLGEVVLNSVVEYCTSSSEELDALDAQIGLTAGAADAKITGPLSGKSFCITGDLTSGSREVVARRIENAGGTFKSAMSSRVSYLVQGTETGRVKRDKAIKLGVPVISEAELYALMGQPVPAPKNTDDREY